MTRLVGIENSLSLPCGSILKNRIGKSAMSENMATSDHRVNQKFISLYRRWAQGGAGLLISGNIMIDHRALGEPRNIVFENGIDTTGLVEWTRAGTQNNTHFWAQLNHPGRQSPQFLSPSPVAPSAIPLLPPLNRFFNPPRALLEEEIQEIIARYASAAKIAQDVGFTGVQIHGAHGYLVSQFLSPRSNQRTDRWGGSLENRMRFVNEVYQRMRQAVGPTFPIGIKLNSADFQQGGFSSEESIEVAQVLSEQGIDLIEISGGTYEAPEMTGKHRKSSTIAREAYFLEYCEQIRKKVKTPLMLTGGFRSLAGMQAALESGACDLVGLARALAIDPDFPKGAQPVSRVKPLTTGVKALDRLFPLEITWYASQLHRMGKGLNPNPKLSVLFSVLSTVFSLGWQNLRRVRGSREN